MKPVVVSDFMAVGEFPTAEQLAILAKAGFRSVLNNQPDGEVARFERSSVMAEEAGRVGLAYAYAPLSNRTPGHDELERYRTAMERLPAPIYAFCYSGSRSAAACAVLLTSAREVDDIVAEFGEAGFDLEGLRPWLQEARDAHEANGTLVAAGNGASHKTPAKAAPAPTVGAGKAEPHVAGLPRMIVVQPRAAGFSGFAM